MPWAAASGAACGRSPCTGRRSIRRTAGPAGSGIHPRTGNEPRTSPVVACMPLTGEYAPSTSEWARTHAEPVERTGGAEGHLLHGRPIIVLTSVGAKSGKLRKTALMRVEHDGEYAVVGSKGGAPEHPVWYYNLV